MKDTLIIIACVLLVERWFDSVIAEYRHYKRLPAWMEFLRNRNFREFMGMKK